MRRPGGGELPAIGRYAAGFGSLLLIVGCMPAHAASVLTPAPASNASAAARMSEAGPEQSELATQVGRWDVVASLWPAPGAEPIVTRGLVAERTMIGPILQESIPQTTKSPADVPEPGERACTPNAQSSLRARRGDVDHCSRCGG
jgi:hypothetical protein